MNTSTKKLGSKFWTTVILFGLVGQIAWVIENMYFNVFIDRTMSTNPFAVATMVALSAIVATVATLTSGILSDKLGKRRHFMNFGYIIWGLVIMSFAAISVQNTETLFNLPKNEAIVTSITFVVIMDCVMTYFGSTANDACFNAWITDNTNNTNRGKVEGILAVMPLFALALVFGGLDWMTQDTYKNPLTGETHTGWVEGWVKVSSGDWSTFYLIIGGVVILAGIIGLFIIKDNKNLKPSATSNFKNMFYGFKKSVIKENKNLYLTFLSMCIINIANNSFMAYLIMYVERTLGFSDYIIPIAVIIVASAITSVVLGIAMDKSKDRRKFFIPLVSLYFAGALFMLIASPLCMQAGSIGLMVTLCFSGYVLMTANLGLTAGFVATTRDLTPKDKIGLFQGVRMVFWVMIPMIVGPMITALINLGSPIIASDAVNNIVIRNYTPYMFLAAGLISSLAIFPIIKLKKTPIEQMNRE